MRNSQFTKRNPPSRRARPPSLLPAGAGGSLPFFNGTFREPFDALVTEAAGTVTMSLTRQGGGDLMMQFSDGLTELDVTPAATITLTAGSDAAPQGNWIYILQTTKVLTKSTTAWPTVEHIKVGFFLVPSATFVATDGPYINQNWNDAAQGTTGQGHLTHITERSRLDGAYYFSGLSGAGVDDYLTLVGVTADLKINTGVVYQMHRHSFPAFDTSSGDTVLVKNWSGDAFHNITNLFDIVADSTGAAITNNKYFNLVIWAAANKTGEYEPAFINLPSGFYNTQSDAENDVDGHDDFSVPREFRLDSSTGILICRLTIQMKTAGPWVYKSTTDLRGFTPITAAGGAAGAVTEFADNQFKLFDETDISKIVEFQLSGLTTATTRTLTVPDASGTILLTGTAIDHGALTGLDPDDDHTQYLLVAGTRAMSGNLDMGDNSIADTQEVAFVVPASTDVAKINVSGDVLKFQWTETGVTTRTFLQVQGPASAVPGDILFNSPSDAAPLLLWDESDDQWEFAKTVDLQNNVLENPLDPTLGTHVGDRDFNDTRYAAAAHTVASHSDTTGTGPELDTLTDGSNADALHVHTPEFADNVFKILDNVDPTKIVDLQLSGLTTATTRTLTVPDASGTILVDSLDVLPGTDVALDLGSATFTWADLFVDSIKDRAGVSTYDVQNAEFDTTHRFVAVTRFADGAEAAPSLTNVVNTDTGIYWSGALVAIATGGTARFFVNVNGPHFPNIGTTGSAANAFILSGSSERLQRSTSAAKYKTHRTPAGYLADVPLVPERFWRDDDGRWFVGLVADDVAAVLPEAGVYDEHGDIENYDTRAVLAVLAAKVNRLEAHSGT